MTRWNASSSIGAWARVNSAIRGTPAAKISGANARFSETDFTDATALTLKILFIVCCPEADIIDVFGSRRFEEAVRQDVHVLGVDVEMHGRLPLGIERSLRPPMET